MRRIIDHLLDLADEALVVKCEDAPDIDRTDAVPESELRAGEHPSRVGEGSVTTRCRRVAAPRTCALSRRPLLATCRRRDPHQGVAVKGQSLSGPLYRAQNFELAQGSVDFAAARSKEVCDLGLIEVER